MKNFTNCQERSFGLPLQSVDLNVAKPQMASNKDGLKKENKPALPYLKNLKPVTSSQSTRSKDSKTGSKSASSEESLNDITRPNYTPSQLSKRSENSFSRTSLNSRQTPKAGSVKSLSDKYGSLQDTSLENIPQNIDLPKITAKCWAIMDGKTGELLFSKKDKRRKEVASLTKMMNLLCVCRLLAQYKIDPKENHVEISKNAASMRGTSACLKSGDVVSIWDLMHGLMLPSGNDAATALAENFGSYIYFHSDEYKAKCEKDSTNVDKGVKNPIKYFLRMMNDTAEELGLIHTHYANSHGLVNNNNYSTAADQAKLTYHLLKLSIVKGVVNKRSYTCEIEQANQKLRQVTWENTNKLLGREGWSGVKTGITTAAGPCLSSYYESQGNAYIIILLHSASMEIRWIEAPKLVTWANTNKHLLKEAN